MRLTRRQFLDSAAAGATVIGLGHLLDPALALGATPDWAADALAGQEPKYGGVLTYGQTYPNWALGQSNRGQHPYYWLDLLTRSVWNCLTWVDEDMNARLELAASLTPNDALDVWDATLREGVTFHDGTEMTSADVVSSIQFHMLGGVGLIRAQIERVEPVGRHGVRFFLNAPNAEFAYSLAEYRAAIFKAADPETIGFDGVGTGPFRLIEIDNARQFRTERNEAYWMEGKPYLDELRGVLALGNAAINGYRAGQLNGVFNIDPGQIGQFRDAGAEIHAAPAGDQFWLVLPKNVNFPWNDQRVRQAMSFAIDRPAINRIVYGDPEGWTGNDTHMTGVNREFLPRAVERDVARARALLAEAGYPDGVDLPAMYFCPSFPEEPRVYPIVTESLAEAGIRLAFEERPCDGFDPFVNGVNQPIGRPRRNLVGPRNPFINLSRLSVRNAAEPGGWQGAGSDRFNALILQAVGEADEARRLELYHEAQRLAQEETPGVMLGGRRNMVAHAPAVKNLRSHSQNWSSRFDNVWIDG
ncbi:ABC transporter substrate-binding protein [Rubrimonas cliftonensis]|uniref:Peptide/nickel transport system substrate-binding protein n=1 Tax=Rubrimonas cliftonensis TaxID=89524 RepID=A0A1H4G4P6_9RHOB|nr:ABC transporter substrate-binding protein [Rubrimonas cliftonensis]SEB03898.1 peptide/nickel transport system substrate-binding protein [Rubrimonas cliftonensis]